MEQTNSIVTIVVLVFIGLVSAREDPINFEGHKVIDVVPRTDADVSSLRDLFEQDKEGILFWSEPTAPQSKVTIQVSPNASSTLQRLFVKSGMPFNVKLNNVQKIINEEKVQNVPQDDMTFRLIGPHVMNLNQYHQLLEVYTWLDEMSKLYSNISEMKVFGKTVEGRDLRLIRIGKSAPLLKPAILIEAGIHSREWVSPATAIYFIHWLLTRSNEPEVASLLTKYDWYIIPIMNPDGYTYTWDVNRMWRKNRQKNTGSSFCEGIDLNRNFDSRFIPASRPCLDNFGGRSPFSEPETIAIRDYATGLAGRLKMYISIHSYSQFWMFPYAHSRGRPRDFTLLNEIARTGVKALKSVHGTDYKYGSVSSILYPAPGSSVDWYYDSLGVKYSFALELRDTGDHGFLLPNYLIKPTAEETWAGVIAAVNKME